MLLDEPYSPVKFPIDRGVRWHCTRCEVQWTAPAGECWVCARRDMTLALAHQPYRPPRALP